MVTMTINLLLSIFLLTHNALALQVTPNSPCASVCLDDPSLDASNPNSSNTNPTDIVCQNADYNNTSVGRKFTSCLDCLQKSTYSSAGEDDQSWFLYNLRYALDSCVFSFSNASGSTSTPCPLPDACGPLQGSLESGNLVPGSGGTYDFCTANSYTLLGSSLPKCIGCLEEVLLEDYLANFLIAIQAGCEQQPPVGTNIGLQGNIFSSTRVNITYPGYDPSSKSTHKGLTQAAIIGMSVGLAVLLVIAVAVLFICHRKRRQTRKMKQLSSPLDSRFGSNNITSPIEGAYTDPHVGQPTQISEAFHASTLSGKERSALGLEMPNFTKQHPIYRGTPESKWQDAHAHFEATHDLIPKKLAIPAHQAYIPTAHVPPSPTESTGTANTAKSYQVSSYASSRSSPKNLPPAIKVPENRMAPPQPSKSEKQTSLPLSRFEPSESLRQTSVAPRGQPAESKKQASPPLKTFEPSESLHQTSVRTGGQPGPGLRDRLPRISTVPKPAAQRISLITRVQPLLGLPRDPTPTEGQVTQFPPRPITLNTNLPSTTTRSRDATPVEGQMIQLPPRPTKLNTNIAPISAAASRSRDPTPIEAQLPQFPARAASPLSTEHPAFMDAEEMTSQAPRPGMHSQQPSHGFEPPARSHSRAGSWKRSGSRGTVRDTSTERTTAGGRKRTGSRGSIRDNSTERAIGGGWKRNGSRPRDSSTERTFAGGWKRSGSRGTIRDSSVERPAAPVRISGPMIKHGARFDFESTEQEVRESDDKLKKGPDATPSSAESREEQWPGTY